MQFLTVLVLASSASASVLRRQGTSSAPSPAAASGDVAALFTGFSDAQCSTVNTMTGEVTYSEHDGYCQKIQPAQSLTAVDANPESDVAWDFWAYTSDDCDPETAVYIGSDECHTAPDGLSFLSFLMTSDPEGLESEDDSLLVERK